MFTCIAVASFLSIVFYLSYNAYRHITVLNLTPTVKDFRLLVTALDIRYTDALIMLSFIYRRRRLYPDMWVGLWFHIQKGEDEEAREYYGKLVDEALTDLNHLRSEYVAYANMCHMEVGDSEFEQSKTLELITLFKPFFESAFGKNGDVDDLAVS